MDHGLEPQALVTAALLPKPRVGERAAYVRTIARAQSEWPLVEALARLVVRDGAIVFAAVSVGGVAARPLRMREVEKSLVGAPATSASFGKAAKLGADRAAPLPMTGYKVPLLVSTIEDALEKAMGNTAAETAPASAPKLPAPHASDTP